MKSSSFVNNQVSLFTKTKEYLHAVKEWLPQTPERALEQAYQAAVKIKSLKNDYFDYREINIKSIYKNS